MAIGTPFECYAAASSWPAASVFSPTATLAAGTVGFLMVAVDDTRPQITGVSDSVGNVWTIDENIGIDSVAAQLAVASAQIVTPVTPTDTITLAHGLPSGTPGIWVQTVTGLATTGVFDQGTGTTGNGGVLDSGPTGTLANANEIVWGVFRNDNNRVFHLGATYTAVTTNVLGPSVFMLEYKIVSSTSPVSADCTTTFGANWSALVATYKGAPTGAAPGLADNVPHYPSGRGAC